MQTIHNINLINGNSIGSINKYVTSHLCKQLVHVTLTIYSLGPIIFDTFDKNKKFKEFVRNLQKYPTRTSFNFESAFQ
jgi:hypothetical protein